MKRFTIFLFFTLFLTTATLTAETVRIRSGVVLAAEIGKNALSVADWDADAFPDLPAQKVYAVVSLRLDPLRAISIFDYSLGEYGRKFPCIAIEKNGRFVYTTETISSGETVQLLFVLDAKQFALQDKEKLTLFCNLTPADGTYDTKLIFKNRFSNSFTPKWQIPAAGMMETTKQ